MACVVAGSGALQSRSASHSPRIEISFAKAVRGEAVTGMVYVAISRTNDRTPIQQANTTGVPLFSL